jgi:perosamine synthetase
MKIPFAKPLVNKKDIYHLNKAANSQWIAHGKYVEDFEKKLKNFLNINYVRVTSSCSSAISLSFLILGLKAGDEIVVPGYGFLAAANIAKNLDLKVKFADVDENTFCTNAENISKVLSKKTRLIIVTHTYGNMCDMQNIASLARRRKIYLMEDAAQALGSKYKNKFAGTIGDIGVFSFTSTKTLVTGEGGAICVKKKTLYDKITLYRNYGYMKKNYCHEVAGYNLKMSNLLASIGFSQMNRLNQILKKRKKVYALYKKKLKDNKFSFQKIEKRINLVPWTCSVKLNKKYTKKFRNYVIKKLKKNGIEVKRAYYCPNELPFFKKKYKLPISSKLSKRLISLPIFEEIKVKEIIYICKKFNEIFK